ncbi:hypothetical protein CWC46_07700 [Prodigiosinella confusarubida]|uniref:DUF669 domain-containing protein n=1 Tax=Serratia sp. (strain ATCC 39006) TaxID=104623 RepID=A0A2I5THI5_SERS3|nr:hypothetical protein [Serratia sp. ATCC 39006]AUG99714.1 hypothetical protein CWC46_07700 [Serratia sp. ATCC 39006]AUH04033.1 hypothetical protein Ser39006_007705 [Serratia sp. ATCC 39006]
MNQPMSFVWNADAAEMAKKAGASAGISETGAYEGVITSAIYTFGRDGSQSQALELSLDSNGVKANYLRINFIGKDGQQTFGMGLVSALMWVAQVKQAQPVQVPTAEGTEWHCPALEGKKIGLFLQKVLYTKQDGSDGYKFEVRHVFQPGTRRTYAEHAENAPAEAIANLENSMKDKDERNHDHRQSTGQREGQQGNPYTSGNPYDRQNGIPQSKLQQAAAQQQSEPIYDDDIPF